MGRKVNPEKVVEVIKTIRGLLKPSEKMMVNCGLTM